MSEVNYKTKTDVVVIGAGHAGVEAAIASAKIGADTVLFTISLDAIANMPCNPSIGGSAKGHLVYEVDALGGVMGRIADQVTLQSRTLNTGKGAAVHAKRVQADRALYRLLMKEELEHTRGLRVVQGEVVEILTEVLDGKQKICGVRTKLGEEYACSCVIVATGTYLKSEIFVGNVHYSSGPDGFHSADSLSASLMEHGVKLVRFKTGTPPRVKKETIDFDQLAIQDGEENPLPFSAETPENYLEGKEQVPCHIVYTNADTHSIILSNIKRSALFSGNIHGTGPRYCPSIEDKLVRFADKERHQLFVEPLGRNTEEMYIQGFSTSLPTDVQVDMLHSLKGFEHAQIMRYAYAIEYDCVDPLQLNASLEFKNISGLFGAGQFNGTSGYEEAAAQGLIAGINAASYIKGRKPLVLSRDSSYIGTLIDDLVVKGTNEPYRMMTSRSEFRLLLRQDNADERLTRYGYEYGLISEERYQAFLAKQERICAEMERLETTFLSPAVVNAFLVRYGEAEVQSGISLADLLRRPAFTYAMCNEIDTERPVLSRREQMSVEVNVKYAGYIKRQQSSAERLHHLDQKALPDGLDYFTIKGLRIEAAQKLNQFKPQTIGQASRISGVNPADITVLLIYLGLK
ncbi:MAG: tRNA uridine-5-carboxymethylaminomethyl(34) synthesis enzyme MnmG [Clostridia bacterium]|nr:tRNA uridine-5-carboxymethylaminomethyl(34) synthesis enzyme MnmG [Clostridia bacterium]